MCGNIMVILRDRICDVFKEYTDAYDSTATKIKLKIDHTYRVADISERIANSLDLATEDVELAWLIGMLHDIGRFEQVRRYNTFSDADSIDHAIFGAQLLFDEGLIEKFLGDDVLSTLVEEDLRKLSLIKIAISNHSAYRIADNLSQEEKLFCNIIRDADKIDILKVNSDLPLEEIYNVSTSKLKSDPVTPKVLEAFYEEHAVLRKYKETSVDNVVGHISLVYELVYAKSYEILMEQGYIYKLMDFESDNPDTNKTFEGIRKYMGDFLVRKSQTKKG